ncbi:MAG: LysE family translocator [Candidatus Thalassarchaeaceae archaeon]
MILSIVDVGALLALVTIGIATPGPNNMTCFVHSGVHGWRKTVSLIFGMVLGFVALNSFVLFIVLESSGIGSVSTFIHWMGVVFIILLGLAISRVSAVFEVTEDLPLLGMRTGFLMQWVNGKEWGFVSLYMTQFLDDFGGGFQGGFSIIGIVTVYCIFGISTWTAFGQTLEGAFRSKKFTDRAFPVAGVILVIIGLAAAMRGA